MRRQLIVAGAVTSVLAAAAAVAWYAWVPRYRPGLRAGETYGVDVSHHQGAIDWKRVAADDVSFAYLKASEGGDHVDERFAANWAEAGGAGLALGAYHFFTLCTAADLQARNFLAQLKGRTAALAPALDLELAGNCSQRPPRTTVAAEITRFLKLVETATKTPVLLYIGDDFEEHYDLRSTLNRLDWRRRFLRRPMTDRWRLWQFTGRADVDGIEGPVDMNVMRSG